MLNDGRPNCLRNEDNEVDSLSARVVALEKILVANGIYPTPALFGDNIDNSTFEADGTLKFNGDATVWDDLRVPVTSTRKGASKQPGFAKFKDDGGGSQGVFIDWFDKSTEEEVYFVAQFPHSYKLGSTIHPHVHWTPKVDGAEGKKVRWGFEYTWQDIGGVFGDSTIIYAEDPFCGDTALLADKHYLTNFPDVLGTGIGVVSSMLIGRLFRDATALTDDYDNDAGVFEIDFHYEIDTVGSRLEYTK